MATQYNILERYGIKEVADVVFLKLTDDGTEIPVLFLDSLKVSTIEETAESTEARGGKGNAPLLSWDYNKEINVTITDALYSPKSLALMHSQYLSDLHVYNGDTTLKAADEDRKITKYCNVVLVKGKKILNTTLVIDESTTAKEILDVMDIRDGIDDSTKITFYRAEDNQKIDQGDLLENQTYIAAYDVLPAHKSVIKINADTFPGTYKIVGDTYSRSDATGDDDYFQFIIHKAKINPETTITQEAEGDPSVFDMSIKVLRPANGPMMELVQYDFNTGANGQSGSDEITVHYKDNSVNGIEYSKAGEAGSGTSSTTTGE